MRKTAVHCAHEDPWVRDDPEPSTTLIQHDGEDAGEAGSRVGFVQHGRLPIEQAHKPQDDDDGLDDKISNNCDVSSLTHIFELEKWAADMDVNMAKGEHGLEVWQGRSAWLNTGHGLMYSDAD